MERENLDTDTHTRGQVQMQRLPLTLTLTLTQRLGEAQSRGPLRASAGTLPAHTSTSSLQTERQ